MPEGALGLQVGGHRRQVGLGLVHVVEGGRAANDKRVDEAEEVLQVANSR